VNGANLQYAEAVRAANQAIDLNPNNATAYAYAAAGLVLPEDPEKYQQAQEMANTAVTLDPANPIAHYYMATVFEYQGYYSAAIEQYLIGLDNDPDYIDLYIGLAYNYYGTSNLSEAVLTFQEAISRDPDNVEAYDGLAFMYIQLGEDALAQEYAQKAVELDPTMARANGRLGEVFYRQNNYEQAIPPLEAAVSLYGEANNNNARFFSYLATAYIRDDLTKCPSAEPLSNQVIQAVTVQDSPAESLALGGLEICRRAALEGNSP
jgi:tetratricopeptide (TPR) repeat protein